MSHSTIYRWIKTPCGRSKFLELSNRKGFFSRIRLYWFVLVAALKDLSLPAADHFDGSDS